MFKRRTSKEIYDSNIRNCKAIKRKLEKSWMWKNFLKDINFILDNYKLEHEETLGFYEWLSKAWHWGWFPMWWISSPQKIKVFNAYDLDRVKKAIENKEDYSDYTYWKFDYSISTKLKEDWDMVGWYSREYKWCGNWYYSILLDYDTYLFLEAD